MTPDDIERIARRHADLKQDGFPELDYLERATLAACAEAGWDWAPEEHVPSPADAMRPIVAAALAAAETVEEEPGGAGD